mmetsp:Transcript_9233/g.30480  ORF Transcript_9233/g.30480 Transcript_9233/m.30480 type:complete len:296 (+) Transcript_9233:1020-1907(+)
MSRAGCPLLLFFEADLGHGIGGAWEVDDGGLHLGHHRDGIGDALRADPRVFDALERKVVGSAGGGAVHLHRPRLHRVRDAERGVNVLRKDAPLEAVLALVDKVERLRLGADAHDGHHRPERLLPREPHIGSDVVDEHGPDEVPLALEVVQELRPLLPRILHECLDKIGALLGHDGGDVGVVLRLPNLELAHFLCHRLHELVRNLLKHHHHLYRRAALPRVRKAAFDDVGHREREVRVGEHHARILAAEFHLKRHHPRLFGDCQARVPAGEADAVHGRMRHQIIPNLRPLPGDEVD